MEGSSVDDKRLAEIRKIRNCVSFIDNGAGVPETMAAFDDLLAEVDRLNGVIALLRAECGAARRVRHLINVASPPGSPSAMMDYGVRIAATDAAGITLEPNK